MTLTRFTYICGSRKSVLSLFKKDDNSNVHHVSNRVIARAVCKVCQLRLENVFTHEDILVLGCPSCCTLHVFIISDKD